MKFHIGTSLDDLLSEMGQLEQVESEGKRRVREMLSSSRKKGEGKNEMQ